MRKVVISRCLGIIKDNNPKIDQTELEKIEYGLVSIYILVTKLLFILTLALIIGREFC